MGPVKEKWGVEYTPPIDGKGIHSIEEWDGDQSIDTLVYHRRGTAALWTAVAFLAVALVVAVAYGYSVISKQNTELLWLSGRVSSLGTVPNRVNNLSTLFNEWSVRQAMLAARVQTMDSDWRSGVDGVRLRAAGMVANAMQSEHNDLNLRADALHAEISQVSARQQAQLAHIGQLERQLVATRQELANAKANYARRLAALHQQQVSNQQQIDSLNDVLSTNQIDFQAQRNRDEEIVPGVTLHLTGTNLAHQSFRGWIRIAGRRRSIWVRNHPAELPIVFYQKPGGEAYELVVTKVGSEAVSGYLLVPGNAGSQQQDAALNSRATSWLGEAIF